MKKIKKINGIQNGDNFVGSGFYFLSLTVSLITLVMQSISVEIEYESVPFAFISLIEYAFSNENILLIFVSIFYIATLLFSIRGIIICIKSWICQVAGSDYKITFLEKVMTYIVLGVTILLFILWIILNERTTVYYGAIIFLFTTILNSVFLRRGC